MTPITDLSHFEQFITGQPAAAIWFSTPDCGVCDVLKPKVAAMLEEDFPALALGYVDCTAAPAIAAQLGIFSVPVLVVWFDGREALRKVRNFSIAEVRAELERPYQLMFG